MSTQYFDTRWCPGCWSLTSLPECPHCGTDTLEEVATVERPMPLDTKDREILTYERLGRWEY